MKRVYNLADKNILIDSIYDDVHEYCKDYISKDNSDFTIKTIEEDIDFEREKSKNEALYEKRPIINYSNGYLEELAIYRKIANKLLDYDTILFHGSCISIENAGYLFTAKSGTGKSTHTALWRKYFKDKATMVNDDKPLIHIGDSITIYGTPYDGKHRISNNIKVPLKAICILSRGKDNKIKKITKDEAYSMLMQQVYKPVDKLKLIKTLELVDKMADKVNLYHLECNMDIEAAKIAYEGMK